MDAGRWAFHDGLGADDRLDQPAGRRVASARILGCEPAAQTSSDKGAERIGPGRNLHCRSARHRTRGWVDIANDDWRNQRLVGGLVGNSLANTTAPVAAVVRFHQQNRPAEHLPLLLLPVELLGTGRTRIGPSTLNYDDILNKDCSVKH